MRLSNFAIKAFMIASISAFLAPGYSRKLAGEPLSFSGTPEEMLHDHGIPLTEHAVVAALGDKDILVRRSASYVLANRWPGVAASVIEQAMLKDPDGFNRISMAEDLITLGDTAGRQALVKECHNATEWGSTRIEAAAALSEKLGDYSCADSILSVLQVDSDPRDTAAKEHALELAPGLIVHIAPVGAVEAHNLFELVVEGLGDPWRGVRTTASRMLVQIGNPAAIPSMEAAIAKERDEYSRKMMTKDPQNLVSKTQIHPR